MMDATDHNCDETEISMCEQICPRHGVRVHQYHGCPKCVMEEVRRHENRIHAPIGTEAPIPADTIGNVNPFSIEMG
ncbi:MAG TPA: hypothetical protein VFJ52_13840 [Terriglobia bacterium]|nr:hypothetical protein [Terriglobia bacterium]